MRARTKRDASGGWEEEGGGRPQNEKRRVTSALLAAPAAHNSSNRQLSALVSSQFIHVFTVTEVIVWNKERRE